MKGNYSPYNRTFKFICLQNQIAHIKNRSAVKSQGKSNITLKNSPDRHINDQLKKSSYLSTNPHFNSVSIDDSGLGKRKHSFNFVEPYRVVHMNQAYDRKKRLEQYHQN